MKSMKTEYGSVVIMLHSHLPYYRKHGMWPFGEENLYECMAETYIPLIQAVELLEKEGKAAKYTVGLTPILVEQLADPELQQGFIDYLNVRKKAASEDVVRYSDEAETAPEIENKAHLLYLAKWYVSYFQTLKDVFEEQYQRDLVKAFKRLQDKGLIEITTSGATHGFSPLLGCDESVNAQFKVGVEAYKRHFGVEPKGCWIPECAYRPEEKDSSLGAYYCANEKSRPSTDAFLAKNHLQYFFTEYHAIEGGVAAASRRAFGFYGSVQHIPLPPRPETGCTTYEAYWMPKYPVAVMGRNNRASFQVWSAAHGYPGDGLYREFHKKDTESGLHYWALTSKDTGLGDKMLYDPNRAFGQTDMQSSHFVDLCYQLLKEHYEQTGKYGLLTVCFDTELFGHWWFEGVQWLKEVSEKIQQCNGITIQTAGEYLTLHPPEAAIELPECSWGQGGHYWVWQNHHVDWMWPIIHNAEKKMKSLVEQYKTTTDETTERVLNQAFRELLLLESSDWPFLVTTFQAKDYAIERFENHVSRFWLLANMLDNNNIDLAYMKQVETLDNPFGQIDFRWFAVNNKAIMHDSAATSAGISGTMPLTDGSLEQTPSGSAL